MLKMYNVNTKFLKIKRLSKYLNVHISISIKYSQMMEAILYFMSSTYPHLRFSISERRMQMPFSKKVNPKTGKYDTRYFWRLSRKFANLVQALKSEYDDFSY